MPGARLTLTDGGPDREEQARGRPFLFHVLECQRPVLPSARHCLEGTGRVIIGRGAGPAVRAGETLRVFSHDPYASTTHATLTRDGAGWRLDDSSKNGTFINGTRVSGAAGVPDRSLIEIAGSFFILRTQLESDVGDRRDVQTGEIGEQPGLTTLLPAVQRVFDALERIATTPVPVVITGETGTGKEVVARAVHRLSRRPGPFVAMSCGALHAAAVEPDLFGTERGAFAGAEERHGLVRSADGGTLLLDEVGDLPLPAQAALLRVLQEQEVMPVGGSRPIPIDVRVISTSSTPLDRLVAARTLRPDLEARLSGVAVALPALADRMEDLGVLIAQILRRALPTLAHHVSFEKSAARALFAHGWPKNVRELEQALTAALALSGSRPIALEHLPAALGDATLDEPVVADPALLDELSRHLEAHQGNVSAVARAMGKPRKQIQRWLKRFGLDAVSFRKP